MTERFVLVFLLICSIARAQEISQKKACEKFSSAVVAITAGGESHGTGFLVGSDGYLLTASHVVQDHATNTFYQIIDIELSTGEHVFAKPAIKFTPENFGQDYALLKLEKVVPGLHGLVLGSTAEAVQGADGTVIGFPFSAIPATNGTGYLNTKFCLTTEFAASAHEIRSVPVSNQQRQTIMDVVVDVIYFQGTSIKGISGSPVISRDTGHVVGIVSTKLAGISPELDETRKKINQIPGELEIGGVGALTSLKSIIDTLDRHLANGLGAAVGIEQAAKDLEIARPLK